MGEYYIMVNNRVICFLVTIPMGNTQFLLTVKLNSLTIFRIHKKKKFMKSKSNYFERRRNKLLFLFWTTNSLCNIPFELYYDIFFTTVGMNQT